MKHPRYQLGQSWLEKTPRLGNRCLNESPSRIITCESCPTTPQNWEIVIAIVLYEARSAINEFNPLSSFRCNTNHRLQLNCQRELGFNTMWITKFVLRIPTVRNILKSFIRLFERLFGRHKSLDSILCDNKVFFYFSKSVIF